ncbi:MAG TPA: arginine--tRNA ligase [Actinomycetota bacterium]|nr:arginine--tRNA ligase [Actinomycetota bacterium]
MIEAQLADWLGVGLRTAAPDLGLDPDALPAPELTATRQKEHGDFATNVALALAGRAGRPPREVAAAIVAALPEAPFVDRVEIAGPGFINLFTTEDWLHDVVRRILAEGPAFGRGASSGERVQVEFVSANPTGPLTIGHARNAAIGDTLARLLAFAGHEVEREYYFNDAGEQMDRFGASVEARYLQALGRDAPVPEDGYHGDYVRTYAEEILAAEGPGLADLPPEERFVRLRSEGARRAMDGMRATLARFGIAFDTYLREASLEDEGEIAQAIERLTAAGATYESEGALWFRSTVHGDDKDRVLVRSNGRHTYFAADCAYVIDKFGRGFDHLLYVWGADHHGDVVRVMGAATVLGYDVARLELLLYQFVTFLRGGEPVKMSKRAGTFVTLDELIDEVGADAARFHLLLFSNDHAMNFDIEEVARASMDNPVYYVQYAHARIASILRAAAEAGHTPDAGADLALLTHEAELDLARALAGVPGVIAKAADLRAPHRLTHAAQDLAARCHRFYTESRVLGEDESLSRARLALAAAAQRTLAILLGLVGVTAPERMDRDDG